MLVLDGSIESQHVRRHD